MRLWQIRREIGRALQLADRAPGLVEALGGEAQQEMRSRQVGESLHQRFELLGREAGRIALQIAQRRVEIGASRLQDIAERIGQRARRLDRQGGLVGCGRKRRNRAQRLPGRLALSEPIEAGGQRDAIPRRLRRQIDRTPQRISRGREFLAVEQRHPQAILNICLAGLQLRRPGQRGHRLGFPRLRETGEAQRIPGARVLRPLPRRRFQLRRDLGERATPPRRLDPPSKRCERAAGSGIGVSRIWMAATSRRSSRCPAASIAPRTRCSITCAVAASNGISCRCAAGIASRSWLIRRSMKGGSFALAG